MNIITEAFLELYPNEELKYRPVLKYSGKFKGFNANVKLSNETMTFSLSKKWRDVSPEIQIGLIQELLVKVLKKKKHTSKMDLYNMFIKNLHVSIPKTMQDPMLLESFNRVNEKYFYGMVEAPNLMFGSHSYRKLGSYDFGSDTITISRIFEKEDMSLLDYVMYHEMLHKKHKFSHKNGRSYHHTREFRVKEKEFEGSEILDRRLKTAIRKRPLFSFFGRI